MTAPPRHAADVTHTTLSVFFIALLVISCYWVLQPFLTAIVWATIVSVATWPYFLRLERAVGRRRGLAVTIMTAGLLLVVFVPVTLALITIVRNAHHIGTSLEAFESAAVPAPPGWLEGVPVAGGRAVGAWRRFAALDPDQRTAVLAPYAQMALEWFVATAGSIGAMLLQFVLTAIVSAILLANGEGARDAILRFAVRLGGPAGAEVTQLAAQAIRGVVLGVAGTALAQTTIGAIGLYLTGVPAAGLLSAVMLFLCLAQLGPVLVLGPAVAWLYWSGQSGAGTTLLVITIVDVALDNVVRPVLIRRGANLPLLLIFAGVLGGLVAFGIVGLFIGPVVLTVAYTLASSWMAAGDAADTTAQVL
jgi:predicted PurR-regulated permease PerM